MTFPDLPEVVRRRMSRVRQPNTKPESIVMKAVRSLGIGFRLNRRDLPGTPDLAFIGRRKAIYVHRCFWHQQGCRLTGKVPVTWVDYLAEASTEHGARRGGDREARGARIHDSDDLGVRGSRPGPSRSAAVISERIISVHLDAVWCILVQGGVVSWLV